MNIHVREHQDKKAVLFDDFFLAISQKRKSFPFRNHLFESPHNNFPFWIF
jgi:hypothetical protein